MKPSHCLPAPQGSRLGNTSHGRSVWGLRRGQRRVPLSTPVPVAGSRPVLGEPSPASAALGTVRTGPPVPGGGFRPQQRGCPSRPGLHGVTHDCRARSCPAAHCRPRAPAHELACLGPLPVPLGRYPCPRGMEVDPAPAELNACLCLSSPHPKLPLTFLVAGRLSPPAPAGGPASRSSLPVPAFKPPCSCHAAKEGVRPLPAL